jgi:hypothetical protein
VTSDLAYRTYWARKKLITESLPPFPVRRWWPTEGLCDIEDVIYRAVAGARNLLDVGAGDLRIQRKLVAAGYGGTYRTQDVGAEGEYTYRSLDDVRETFGAILLLDVLEHLPLAEGLEMIDRLVSLLEPRGVLVLQTPNAHYLPDPRAWDMTHLHVYNMQDLWAFLRCMGLSVDGYRVTFGERPRGPVDRLRFAIVAYVKRKILGCDFANNLVLIARKP